VEELMKAHFDIDGVRHEVVPVRRAGGMAMKVGQRERAIALRRLDGGEAVVTVDGRPHRVWLAQQGEELFVHLGGRAWRIRTVDDVDAAQSHGAADDTIVAPMPGTVVSLAVAPGDAVKRGDTVIVIESMKLESSLKAPRDGVVASLPLGKGATFDRGALLATLEPQA
jgi:3-methylcrotonyl-CoA carboxylase alpha subunit